MPNTGSTQYRGRTGVLDTEDKTPQVVHKGGIV
ncbi:hypothetical protein NEIRO02_2259 [Nematocida sp. AWRm79]|nr:hypothetical protein NEIRO02_2259 [Nematocida sp. AWRm79]